MDENELTPVVEGVEEPTEVAEEPEVPEETPEPEEETVILKKSDYTKLNRKAIAYEANKNKPIDVKSLDVEDYIDISASLEGLDQQEKSYLAQQHKLTGKPLTDIRKSEDFGLWQNGHKAKVEKELSLRPSGTQSESDRPMSFTEKLRSASLADKEKILIEAGLYRSPRPRMDRVDLGRGK